MGRRKRVSKIEAEVATFVTGSENLIAPWLADFGFFPGAREVSRYGASLAFINDVRYVRLYVNVEPRDPPRYCSVVLGEGSLEWPEVDWNGVALWRLARDQGESEFSEYPLETEAAVPDLVERMREDLERYGLRFLQGDVAAFRRVRAETNRARAPYRIYRPIDDGSYASEVDPKSAELKARFS